MNSRSGQSLSLPKLAERIDKLEKLLRGDAHERIDPAVLDRSKLYNLLSGSAGFEAATDDIALAAVTSSRLADGAVNTNHLADRAATPAKTDFPDFGDWFGTLVYGSEVSFPNVANRMWWHRILVPTRTTATGVWFYNGTTINGSVRVALYDSTLARIANRTTNTAQGAINSFQKVAFDAPVDLEPGYYFPGVIHSATGHFYVGKASSPFNIVTQGSFTTPATITLVDPANTGSIAPWMGIYG